MSELTNYIVGFSSHTPDVSILSAAVALGAKVVEFHITSDRDQVGTDHLSSFELSELQLVISTLHHVSQSLGLSTPRYPSQGELNNRISLSKSLCYKSDLNVGHTLIQSDFCLKSPGSGLPYSDLYSFIGRTLLSDVSYSQPVQHSHINDNQVLIKTPSLPKSLELGLPIRYHDAISLHDKFNLPCYEIHYSDKDLSLTPDQFLPKHRFEGVSFSVHAIEQYSDNFIIDFASDDLQIRSESFRRIDSLISHVDSLKSHLSIDTPIKVILNLVGLQGNPSFPLKILMTNLR